MGIWHIRDTLITFGAQAKPILVVVIVSGFPGTGRCPVRKHVLPSRAMPIGFFETRQFGCWPSAQWPSVLVYCYERVWMQAPSSATEKNMPTRTILLMGALTVGMRVCMHGHSVQMYACTCTCLLVFRYLFSACSGQVLGILRSCAPEGHFRDVF